MDYEKKLKDALGDKLVSVEVKEWIEEIFPELVESEDERIRKELIEFVKSRGGFKQEYIAWLEKQAEQKPVEDRYMEGYLNGINDTLKSAAWSEEDKEIIDYLIDYLESELDSSYTDLDKETFTKEINWLKSLRPQSQWRPTDEQMEALEHFIVHHNGSTNYAKDLEELRLQLKKLMEK